VSTAASPTGQVLDYLNAICCEMQQLLPLQEPSVHSSEPFISEAVDILTGKASSSRAKHLTTPAVRPHKASPAAVDGTLVPLAQPVAHSLCVRLRLTAGSFSLSRTQCTYLVQTI